jgi:type I restriction enzyme S subunit
MSWQPMPLKRALRPAGQSSGLIKGSVAHEPEAGLFPGYSASGQDVWLAEPQFDGDGLVLSAVGARCGKVFQAMGRWGTVANTVALLPQPGYSSRFLWYLTNNEDFWEKGGTAQPYVRVEETLNRRVDIPALADQCAIASYLDRTTVRLDNLITAKGQMLQLLEERRQVIMHDAAAGLLTPSSSPRRPTSVPWLPDVPRHWRDGLLKLSAKLGTGHTPSRSHPEWWTDLIIPWITTGEVSQMRSDRIEYVTHTRECISELGLANSSAIVHPAGTVVLCRTASAGYSAIMGTDMATSQDFATWTCGPLLRPRFLLLCLRAMRGDLLGRLAMGSTHKTIYMPDIESIKIPIPPIEEQDANVDIAYSRLRPIDACITALREQIGLLEERRRVLVTAAVTGQIEIPEAA